jgi:hypothetical protein
MKIELKIEHDTTLVLSNDQLDNDNYVDMWFETYSITPDGERVKDMDYPAVEPLTVSIKDILKALSAFYEYKETE